MEELFGLELLRVMNEVAYTIEPAVPHSLMCPPDTPDTKKAGRLYYRAVQLAVSLPAAISNAGLPRCYPPVPKVPQASLDAPQANDIFFVFHGMSRHPIVESMMD